MPRLLVSIPLILILIFLAFMGTTAQQAGDSCIVLATNALNSLKNACAGVELNHICYGHETVNTVLQPETTENFTEVGDRTRLFSVDRVEASSPALEAGQWGISLINLQANVPGLLPGEAAKMLVFGEAQLENLVPVENALPTAPSVTLTTIVGSNVRRRPHPDAPVIGSVAAGTRLATDALSTDGNWFRVAYEQQAGWVSRQVVAITEGAADDLPVLNDSIRSPMQNFCLRTGVENGDCGSTLPALLVLQAGPNIPIEIQANGSSIRFTSTILLRNLPGNQFQLIVLDGIAEVGVHVLPAGFTTTALLNGEGCGLLDTWRYPTALTDEEMSGLKLLEQISPNLLHRPIEIPDRSLIQQNTREYFGAVYGPAAGQINCSQFQPIAPLTTIPYGVTTFFWGIISEADTYQLKIFGAEGQLIGTYPLNINNNNTSVNMADPGFGGGSVFAWEVDALIEGEIACTTERVRVLRDNAQSQPVGNPGDSNLPGPLPTSTLPIVGSPSPSSPTPPGQLPTASPPPSATPPGQLPTATLPPAPTATSSPIP
jgi:hypothetical protein